MEQKPVDHEGLSAGVEPVPAPPADIGRLRARGGRRKRWPAPLRWLAIVLSITGGLGICGLLAGVYFVARLEKGPILVEGLGPRIAARLQERFGDGQNFRLGETMIEKGENGPELTINGFSVAGANGEVILAAPKARVSLDPFALVIGDVTPRKLDIVGLELRMSVMPDGAFAITAGNKPIVLTAAAGAKPPVAPAPESSGAASLGAKEEPAVANPSPDAPAPQAGDIEEKQDRSAREAMRPAADALRQLLAIATSKRSPLGALGQFGIVDGKLVFEDKKSGAETVFDNMQMQFQRSPQQAKLLVSVNGPSKRWQMTVTASNERDDESSIARTLEVEFSNLSLDEISLFSGIRELPFDADTPIGVKFRIGAGGDGEFRMARGSFSLGRGYISFRDQDQEPVLIDRVTGSFHWNDDTRRFVLDPTSLESGETSLMFGGEVLPPQSNDGLWSIRLASIGDGYIGGDRPGQSKLALSKIDFAAVVDPQNKWIKVENIELAGPQVHLKGAATFAVEPDGRRFKASLSGERMPVAAIMRLWPSAAGAQVRAWMLQNLKAGTVSKGSMEIDYGEEAFAALKMRRPVPDEAMRLTFDLHDGVLQFLPGVSPVRGVAGTGLVTGKHSKLTITQGHIDGAGRQIAISGGAFTSTNMSPAASPASVSVNLAGQVDTLATILAEPGLKQHAALVLDPSTLKGRIEGKLTVDFKFGAKASNADVSIRAQANATNVSIERLMAKERLENASLQMTIDGKDLTAKGSGRMFGAPATFSFDKVGKGDVNAVLSLVLDDQARQRLGWSTGARLTGPVAMKISGPLSKPDTLQGNVEFDLTRAAIGEIAPGLSKPAGRPAKATFKLVPGNAGTSLQNFTYQAGSTSARGTIELDRKGAFTSAALSSLKVSPGDEMSGDVSASGGNLQVTLRGASIDLRPFIQAITSARPTSGVEGSGTPAGRLSIDMQSKLATGHNRQALADFSLKLTRSSTSVERFDLTARAGRAPVRGQLVPGTARVDVSAGDGGAVMSFLDFYKRMEGGALTLSANVTSTRVDGVLSVQNFVLRDEPALRRLVAEGAPRTDADGRVKIDPSMVNFERLRLSFTKEGGRIQLHDGIISGPQIGTTLEGVVDFPRDQVNMKGTFVPAYGLNNMFAKVPLFGPILGGGRNEGLVGVNFSVTGKASAPFLNVNPLSAITPGFLRKIFGAVGSIDANAQQAPPRPQMPLTLTPAPVR